MLDIPSVTFVLLGSQSQKFTCKHLGHLRDFVLLLVLFTNYVNSDDFYHMSVILFLYLPLSGKRWHNETPVIVHNLEHSFLSYTFLGVGDQSLLSSPSVRRSRLTTPGMKLMLCILLKVFIDHHVWVLPSNVRFDIRRKPIYFSSPLQNVRLHRCNVWKIYWMGMLCDLYPLELQTILM